MSRRDAFLLERAYAKLPKEYAGVKRQRLAPVGGNRSGVLRTAEFYRESVGAVNGQLSKQAWLLVPDHALAEATNGEIFEDHYGEFTAIRNTLLQMPEDVRRKRLAGNLLLMAQSRQYNYTRCLQHGEIEAAQLAATEFVHAAMKTIFLLKRKYMPYYKWSFRSLRKIDENEQFSESLAFLLGGELADPVLSETKHDMIEDLAIQIIEQLQDQNLTEATCADLEKHAYSVNDGIRDSELRNSHILSAVSDCFS